VIDFEGFLDEQPFATVIVSLELDLVSKDIAPCLRRQFGHCTMPLYVRFLVLRRRSTSESATASKMSIR
jgi:hypothetical protein